MAINRKVFFTSVRPMFGAMSDPQVSGCTAIMDEAEKRELDLRFVAYMLATVFWETGKAMQPVREGGRGRGHTYGLVDPATRQIYYGRGLVQLTWKSNYLEFAKLCGVDLVGNPDLALRDDIAVKIMFEGMLGGLFTGKKLADYFTQHGADWTGARRIINGSDKAKIIAADAERFYAALLLK